jgi:hypothetical protein
MLRNTARQARAPQQNRPPLVRSGSKHDYASSTHMSASTSSGCIHALDHGSDVPGHDASLCGHKVTLLDHLVGKREQLVWNFETQRLGGLDVDHEIEPCGLLYGDFAWFHPAQNLIG